MDKIIIDKRITKRRFVLSRCFLLVYLAMSGLVSCAFVVVHLAHIEFHYICSKGVNGGECLVVVGVGMWDGGIISRHWRRTSLIPKKHKLSFWIFCGREV